jgi:Fe-S-cluster containining protein
MNFPCIQCGLCCRALPDASFAAEYNRGDGVCKYLDGNLCAIYEKRPSICNVEAMYQKYFESIMTEEEFVAMNLRACLKIAKKRNNEDVVKKLEALQVGKAEC